jgi:hypothetical protein
MEIHYNPKKATQAAGVLIKKAGGQINFTVLLKLLYLSDRKALDIYGIPVTTDAAYKMKSGMVLSHTYNLIKKDPHDAKLRTYWSSYVSDQEDTDVRLLKDTPTDELSDIEIELLGQVFDEFAPFGLKLIDIHHELPEWSDPGRSSIRVSIEEILAALGKTKGQISEIEKEITLHNLHAELST